MPSTKEEMNVFLSKVKAELLEDNPLDVGLKITVIQKTMEALRKDPDIRDLVLDELTKYTEKIVEYKGNKFEKAETGVKYDYQGDHTLAELDAEKKAIDVKIKERQAFLKTVKGEVFDGDGVRCLPAVKSSTTNYKLILR
tara:strand:- start:9996 stop:10415 length:420 start_codon:yes stop_codon:yes gene_type:complete